MVRRVRVAIETVVRRFRRGRRDDDLTQEVLGRVYLELSRGRFRGDSSLETYARSVARNTCLEYLRRERPMAPLEAERPAAHASSPETRLLRAEQVDRAFHALESLPRSSLDLLRMIFVERLGYTEIALQLGVSESALRVRLHRCRLRIALALSPEARTKNPPVKAERG